VHGVASLAAFVPREAGCRPRRDARGLDGDAAAAAAAASCISVIVIWRIAHARIAAVWTIQTASLVCPGHDPYTSGGE